MTHVRRLHELDAKLLEPLVSESRAAGISFVERLIREWEDGTNRFDRIGERLLGSFEGDALIGCGGINVDPYANDPTLGRIRHVYVRESHRRRHVGTAIVTALLEGAGAHFSRVRLKTETTAAVRFYERLGFESRTIDDGFELARAIEKR